MERTASRIAEKVKGAKDVLVLAHIDADGIAAGSIAGKALERAGKDYSVRFLKSLDDEAMRAVKDENPSLAWFVDLGSAEANSMDGLDAVITDHHIPAGGRARPKKSLDLMQFIESPGDGPLMLNPHQFGMNGDNDLSGSGATYFAARAMDASNRDLACLAIVGAVGDLQDAQHRRLVGANRQVIEDGLRAGVLETDFDLRFFGRETRPLMKLLQYANDPPLPGLADDEEACYNFLNELNITIVEGEHWRVWSDLTRPEKKLIISALVEHVLSSGFGHKNAERLVGEVYMLKKEKGVLRDAKEFSTLLNSCGRYDKAGVGFSVCMGDREQDLERALALLRGHRENIVASMKFINDEGLKELEYLQYFHGKDKIIDTVVGVMAGMVLNSGSANRELPIFAFANSEDGIKVSARATRELVDKGLDLSEVMRKAGQEVGGKGGGHNIAAGATIPVGKEEEFLKAAEKIIKAQMRN